MRTNRIAFSALCVCTLMALSSTSYASTVIFNSGDPDGLLAAASRPDSTGKFEIETADDFVLDTTTSVTGASFTGLLTGGTAISGVSGVRVEIYRTFPQDSETSATDGPPTFSTSQVPTRVNSPSDVAYLDRSSADGNLTFSASQSGSFTANNSVSPGGINPKPNNVSGGNGPITGDETIFSVSFLTAVLLDPGHYFFVPQVLISAADGEFYWLSAPKPITSPGTPFPPGFTDLEGWTRDEALAPDWLRVGSDIVGGTARYNFAFSLESDPIVTPLPATLPLFAAGLGALGVMSRHRKRKVAVAA
jgi:hypothetical protein